MATFTCKPNPELEEKARSLLERMMTVCQICDRPMKEAGCWIDYEKTMACCCAWVKAQRKYSFDGSGPDADSPIVVG